MNWIPQALWADPCVAVFWRGEEGCILEKKLSSDRLEKEGYVTMHALSFVLSGTQRIQVDGLPERTVSSGEWILVPKGMYTISDLCGQSKEFRSLLFYFNDEVLQASLDGNPIPLPSKETSEPDRLFQDKASSSIEAYLDGLLSAQNVYPAYDFILWRAKLVEIIRVVQIGNSLLSNHLARLRLPNPAHLKSFMEAHYRKPLSIADFAYVTGRSESTFRREFKMRFGMSPLRWLKKKRLEDARQLLVTPESSVQEVATQIGYEHASHFIKDFKSYYGISPGAFQRESVSNH